MFLINIIKALFLLFNNINFSKSHTKYQDNTHEKNLTNE